jgi:hypothetical protein
LAQGLADPRAAGYSFFLENDFVCHTGKLLLQRPKIDAQLGQRMLIAQGQDAGENLSGQTKSGQMPRRFFEQDLECDWRRAKPKAGSLGLSTQAVALTSLLGLQVMSILVWIVFVVERVLAEGVHFIRI